jgi:hypothetical protein
MTLELVAAVIAVLVASTLLLAARIAARHCSHCGQRPEAPRLAMLERRGHASR